MTSVKDKETSWTTDAILSRAAAMDSDQIAIVIGEDGSSLTYGELNKQATQMANMLVSHGLKRNDRVAIFMANSLEYIISYHGVGRSGGIFVPIVTQSTLPELSYFLDHSEASFLIVDQEKWEVLSRSITNGSFSFTGIRQIFLVGNSDSTTVINLNKAIHDAPSEPINEPPMPSDPVAFMYTSGSTGKPKAVIHSHYTAVAQAEAVSKRMGYTSEDRLMTVFPLYHGNALVWSALTAVWIGARVIIHRRFSASNFWESARRHGATEVNLLPGAMNMVLAQPEKSDDGENPVRLVLANVTEVLYHRFVKRFNVDIVSTWALTEGPLGTMTSPGHGFKPGEIGWPLGTENEIKVFNEDDSELSPGEVGELVQRNRAIMMGYYKNEDETARILRNGWLHSGDLGYSDENGIFFFVGRKKHVIRRSGELVSGEEVEECLLEHPGVAEAAVVAIPDEIRDEEVKACIIINPGYDISADEIFAWCEDRLADFKVPRYLELFNEFPRTGPLKVDRPALVRQHVASQCWDRTAG